MAFNASDGSVLAELTDIFRAVLDQPDLELTPAATADDVAGWDSMAHITLIVEIECRFGVHFNTAEIESLHDVGELTRAIQAKRTVTAA